MERKAAIHRHLEAASIELLEFVRERMPLSPDGWVPASDIKQSLALNFVAVPKGGKAVRRERVAVRHPGAHA